jgi:hypothetical protein
VCFWVANKCFVILGMPVQISIVNLLFVVYQFQHKP